MRNFLHKLAVVLCVIGLIVYTVAIFAGGGIEQRVSFSVLDAIMILLLWRLLRKNEKREGGETYNQSNREIESTAKAPHNPSKRCAICCGKLGKYNTIQLKDGKICASCRRLSNKSVLCTVKEVKNAWEENHARFNEFAEDMRVSSPGSSLIIIDTKHKYFYLSARKKVTAEPVVFKFSEIAGYEIERLGQQTITKTKSKGGLGRAVVGGALFGGAGAIVGASTAKKESVTKEVGGGAYLNVAISAHGLETEVSLYNPPADAEKAMEEMMNYEIKI